MSQSNLLSRIKTDPTICGGRPIIRGMRIRVSDILDLLSNGLSHAEILAEMPDLEEADIRACLVYVARRFEHPVIVLAA